MPKTLYIVFIHVLPLIQTFFQLRAAVSGDSSLPPEKKSSQDPLHSRAFVRISLTFPVQILKWISIAFQASSDLLALQWEWYRIYSDWDLPPITAALQ
jgi:hypothetical protein